MKTGPSRRRDARSVSIRRAGTASSKRWGRRVPVVMCRRCPIRRLPSAKVVLFDIDGTLIGPTTFRCRLGRKRSTNYVGSQIV